METRTALTARPGRISAAAPLALTTALLLVASASAVGRAKEASSPGGPPGSRQEEVLAYDDGSAESSVTGFAAQKVAQFFQAPSWATHVVAVQYYICDDLITDPNDPQAPTTDDFTAWVWRVNPTDSLPGLAANDGYMQQEGYPEEAWVEVRFPNPIDITNDTYFPDRWFYVGLEWEHRLNPYIGVDQDSPAGMSYRFNWSEWEVRDDVIMIRAVVWAEEPGEAIYIDAAGGGDYTTIGEAVAAAATNDTLYVAPGTYSGPLNRGITFGGRNLRMIAEEGRSETVIDCGGEDRGFLFIDGENETALVEGFTVRNGFGSGAGIRCVNSWPTIIDCAFIQGDGEGYGGGVYCNNAVSPSPTFTDCVFADNVASIAGGGALMDFSEAVFEGCTFAGNAAPDGAGIHCGTSSSPAFERCIIALSESGGAMFCPPTSSPTFFHGCVFGNTGGDDLCGNHYENIFEDPRFCDPSTGDYRLREDSPCLPSANPWGVRMGALGEGCEATVVIEKSWGAIKSLYR